MNLPDWLLNRPIAHRGLHGPGPARPENTLAALRAAAERGYAAEIDVQISADAKAMIFHDYRLERLTAVRGKVYDRTSAQLSRLHIARGRERIPLLTDALRDLPELPLLIELKAGKPELAEATAAALDGHAGPFAVQSFDPAMLAWFAANRPEWPRGLIAFRAGRFGAQTGAQRFDRKFMDICTPHFVGWHVFDLPAPDFVSEAAPVLTWTVCNPRSRRLARSHARNIIFEGFYPLPPSLPRNDG